MADGVHSAGERRMERALAAANVAEGSGGAFFSLRFGAEHGVLPMAEQLLAALRERGASGMIINMAAGRDIDTTVFEGIENCGTFLVFGSAKYGEDTGNQACTYYEYKHAFAKKKRIVLLRMIPFDQEFENLQARVIFNANRLVLPWIVGTPMPADLPDKIIEAMGLPTDAAPQPAGTTPLGMPPSMASPTLSAHGTSAVVQVFEAAATVEAMMADARLSTYTTVFSSEGYEFVIDLLDADPADLEELMTMCGMKKPERKRLERALTMNRASVGGGEGSAATQAWYAAPAKVAQAVEAQRAQQAEHADKDKLRVTVATEIIPAQPTAPVQSAPLPEASREEPRAEAEASPTPSTTSDTRNLVLFLCETDVVESNLKFRADGVTSLDELRGVIIEKANLGGRYSADQLDIYSNLSKTDVTELSHLKDKDKIRVTVAQPAGGTTDGDGSTDGGIAVPQDAVLLCENAGLVEYNGYYMRDAELTGRNKGKQRFRKIGDSDIRIGWCGYMCKDVWVCDNIMKCAVYYTCSHSHASGGPTEQGWQVREGTPPAPTLRYL